MAFVSAAGLNKYYAVAGKRLHVLRDLELEVERGEMVAIMGASGVGKSTLLHVLGGLDTIDGGQVRVGDHQISSMDDHARVAIRSGIIAFSIAENSGSR
jgi:lipoprotein-releasing system ATP-binding protein